MIEQPGFPYLHSIQFPSVSLGQSVCHEVVLILDGVYKMLILHEPLVLSMVGEFAVADHPADNVDRLHGLCIASDPWLSGIYWVVLNDQNIIIQRLVAQGCQHVWHSIPSSEASLDNDADILGGVDGILLVPEKPFVVGVQVLGVVASHG